MFSHVNVFSCLKPSYIESYKKKDFTPKCLGFKRVTEWKDTDNKQENRNLIQIP